MNQLSLRDVIFIFHFVYFSHQITSMMRQNFEEFSRTNRSKCLFLMSITHSISRTSKHLYACVLKYFILPLVNFEWLWKLNVFISFYRTYGFCRITLLGTSFPACYEDSDGGYRLQIQRNVIKYLFFLFSSVTMRLKSLMLYYSNLVLIFFFCGKRTLVCLMKYFIFTCC